MFWIFNSIAAKLHGNEWKIPVNNLGEVVENQVYRSALPSIAALAKMKEQFGIKYVLDLRVLSQVEIDIRRNEVEKLGMRFVHIPMDEYHEIPQDDIRRAVGIVAWTGNHPILVHCKGGVHRTGLVILAFRMWRMGYTWKKAFDEAKKHHFYSGNDHEGVLKSMKRAGGQPYK